MSSNRINSTQFLLAEPVVVNSIPPIRKLRDSEDARLFRARVENIYDTMARTPGSWVLFAANVPVRSALSVHNRFVAYLPVRPQDHEVKVSSRSNGDGTVNLFARLVIGEAR